MSKRVSLMLGRTFNMGNYESMRVDIGLELDGEDVEQTYAEAYKFVTTKIGELSKKAHEIRVKKMTHTPEVSSESLV